MSNTYYVGWDVGAWHTRTKDGVWILSSRTSRNADVETVGTPQSTRIQDLIAGPDLPNLTSFTNELIRRCQEETLRLENGGRVVLGIDACFKFPKGVAALCEGGSLSGFEVGKAIDNNYLYRETERLVATKSILNRPQNPRNPLSSVQSAIGSQATKAQHFLRRFGFGQEEGVWKAESQGVDYTAIEVYPATCKLQSGKYFPDFIQDQFTELTSSVEGLTEDSSDALLCALVAYLFDRGDDCLFQIDHYDYAEGWIWFPKT